MALTQSLPSKPQCAFDVHPGFFFSEEPRKQPTLAHQHVTAPPGRVPGIAGRIQAEPRKTSDTEFQARLALQNQLC